MEKVQGDSGAPVGAVASATYAPDAQRMIGPRVEAPAALHAAEAVERLATTYRGLVEAADILRRVGVGAQTFREIESDIALMRESQIKESAALQALLDAQNVAKAETKRMHDDTRSECAALRLRAEQEAAAIVSQANDQAAHIVRTGEQQNEARRAQADKKLSDVGQQIADARTELEALEKRRDELSGAVSTHEQRLAAIRDAAAQITGSGA